MIAILILIVLVLCLFLLAGKLNEKNNNKIVIKIGVGLIITEIILVLALMESIINLLHCSTWNIGA